MIDAYLDGDAEISHQNDEGNLNETNRMGGGDFGGFSSPPVAFLEMKLLTAGFARRDAGCNRNLRPSKGFYAVLPSVSFMKAVSMSMASG